MKKFLAAFLAVAMLLSFGACKSKPEDPYAESNSAVVMKSDNFTVTYGMMSCYFYDFLANFYNTYYNVLNQFGVDFNSSLKEQTYYEDTSWYDFFMENVIRTVDEMLVLAETAYAKGLRPDESDEEAVDEAIENIKNAAAAYDMTFEEYIEAYYYKGVNEQVLRDALSLSNFAYGYFSEVYSAIEPTEEDYVNYCEANQSQFYACDYYGYLFDLKEDADRLCENETAEEFIAALTEFFIATDEALSPETASVIANSTLVEDYYYTVADSLDKWLFDKDRQAGDKAVIELTKDGVSKYAVVYMKTPYHLVSEETKDVRHILISTSGYDSAEEALAAAQNVYNKWKDGGATTEYFAQLAEQYSDDEGSAAIGGLYQNVAAGTTVDEFDAWIFDPARQPGDTDIVLTKFGYHIMYFVGEGLPTWKSKAKTNVVNLLYSNWLDEASENFEIGIDEERISKIEA